jgi:hypothetical protein
VNFQADYFPALALRTGGDPLASLSDLARLYVPTFLDPIPHASPHPPLVDLIVLPLTFLPYDIARAVWVMLSAALLVWVGRRLGFSWLGAAALMAWPPAIEALDAGDWEIVLLALAVLGWQAAEANRPGRAGLWFGLAAGLKFYPGLFLIPFLARRQWRTLGAAALMFAGCQVLNLLVLGPAGLRRYFFEVLPAVARRYVGLGLNVSPYGAALRLFGGSTDVPPAVSLPWLPIPFAVAVALLAIALAWRARPQAAGLLGILAMPTAWEVYPVLGLPILMGLWRQRDRASWLLIASIAMSFTVMQAFGFPPFAGMVRLLSTGSSLGIALLGAVQAAGCLGLLILATRVDARQSTPAEYAIAGAESKPR